MLRILRPRSCIGLSDFGYTPGGHCPRRHPVREAVARGGTLPGACPEMLPDLKDLCSRVGQSYFCCMPGGRCQQGLPAARGGTPLPAEALRPEGRCHRRLAGLRKNVKGSAYDYLSRKQKHIR